MRARWAWLGAGAAALALASSCGSKCGPSSAMVTSVVDGDTIVLEGGQKVRYLLADAPETTAGKNDCYGAQATDFNRATVEGKTVQLTYDEAECTDRYGRLLAYVKAGGVEVNSALVQQGMACVLYIAPGGQARREEFLTYEAEAKTARTGMWGACTAIPCSL